MEKQNKKRVRHFDRVTLNAEALSRIDSWMAQVESVRTGVLLCRKDILNWLVLNLPEKLSTSQEKGLAEEFYSELRYLQFAAREIKTAEAMGERLTLKDLESRGTAVQPAAPRRKPQKPKDDGASDALGAQESPVADATASSSQQ